MLPEPPSVLGAVEASRRFGHGANAVPALQGASLQVGRSEVVALTGPSGCGKTTLLHLLGGIDLADSGTVALEGVEWSSLSAERRAVTRRRRCGFVFQSLALLPMATAAENVATPLLLDRSPYEERTANVYRLLERVGLAAKASCYPDELSGGEQQRVAIARALVHRPAVVLADEPTGSLDSATAKDITSLLIDAALETGAAVVIVTHDERVAAHADRVVRLDSGRIVRDELSHALGDF